MKPYGWGEEAWRTFCRWVRERDHEADAAELARRAYEQDGVLTVEEAARHPQTPAQIYHWPLVDVGTIRQALGEVRGEKT